MAAHLPEVMEDDGSVFTETNGVKKYFAYGDLVYPCSKIESYWVKYAKYRSINTVQTLWLEYDHQIRPEDVLKALWIVSRQVPHLQFCISKRKDKLWLKRMVKLEIDFEITTKDQKEIHDEMLETYIDLWKGPLWKVRLNLNYNDDKILHNKKHSAYLTLCVHHAITDATANMKICRELVFILNKISAGEKVEPVSTPLSPTIDDIAQEKFFSSYVVNKLCRKIFSTVLKNFNNESAFNGALPCPTAESVKAKYIFNNFSNIETEFIIQKCKDSKITVNSFILTVANFALMSVAQERSKIPIGRRKIVTLQTVNSRRYLEPQFRDASGCHISFIDDEFPISLNDSSNFWTSVKEIHVDIKDRLLVFNDPIRNIPFTSIFFKTVPINSFLTSKGYQNRTLCHYTTSNMGNLKDLLPEAKKGENIEIINLLRSVSPAFSGFPFMLSFHTFRDRLMVSVDYGTNNITDETAQAFLNRLFKYVRNIIQFDKLS